MTIQNLELLNALKEDLKEFVNNDEKNCDVPCGTDTGGGACNRDDLGGDYGIGTGNGELKQCGLR